MCLNAHFEPMNRDVNLTLVNAAGCSQNTRIPGGKKKVIQGAVWAEPRAGLSQVVRTSPFQAPGRAGEGREHRCRKPSGQDVTAWIQNRTRPKNKRAGKGNQGEKAAIAVGEFRTIRSNAETAKVVPRKEPFIHKWATEQKRKGSHREHRTGGVVRRTSGIVCQGAGKKKRFDF